MPVPRDKKLYEMVKKRVYKKIPKHSAYRSGVIVKTYKKKNYEICNHKRLNKKF